MEQRRLRAELPGLQLLPRGSSDLCSGARDSSQGAAGAGPGQAQAESRERFFPQRVLGTAQAPQGMGTAPRLPELQERLDSAARDAQGGAVGGAGQGQGLHWMVLVGPVQLSDLGWRPGTPPGAGTALPDFREKPQCCLHHSEPFTSALGRAQSQARASPSSSPALSWAWCWPCLLYTSDAADE